MDSLPKFKLGEIVYAPEFELKDEENWDSNFPDVDDLLKYCDFESGKISKITQTMDGVMYDIDGVGPRSEPYVAKTKVAAIAQSLKALLDYCTDKSDKYRSMADKSFTKWSRYKKLAE